MDTETIRAKTLEAYRQGPEAVVELVVRLVAEFAGYLEALASRSVLSDSGLHLGSSQARVPILSALGKAVAGNSPLPATILPRSPG